jgi:hypothetical protein
MMRLLAWCGTSHATSSAFQAVLLHDLRAHVGHVGHGEFEHGLAFLVDEVLLASTVRSIAGRMEPPAFWCRYWQPLPSLRRMLSRMPWPSVVSGSKQHRAGTIAEDDAGGRGPRSR